MPKLILFGGAAVGLSLALGLAYEEWKAARRRACLRRVQTRARRELYRYQFVHQSGAPHGERIISQ